MSSSVKPTALPVMLVPVAGPEQLLSSQKSLGTSRKTRKTILGLAVTQLTLALIIIVWLSLLLANDFVLSWWGFLWALGVVIVLLVTGSIGITASKISSHCWLITFMVLCILSAIFSFAIIGLYITGLVDDASGRWKPYCISERDSYEVSRAKCYIYSELVIAMYALVLVFFFAEMLISVIASAFSCHALGRCCRGRPEMLDGVLHQQTVSTPGVYPNYSPVSQTKDMFPLEHGDVSPTGSRPPSYVSMEGSSENKRHDCCEVKIVDTV